MPNLKSLTVANAKIKDPSFFTSLKQLKHLALRGNEFSDVTPIVKMDNLDSLDLSNNKITNVAPLIEMKNKKFIFIRQPNRRCNSISENGTTRLLEFSK